MSDASRKSITGAATGSVVISSIIRADLLYAVVGGDQLATRGRIHAVETRRNSWRAGDAHVHFAGAGGYRGPRVGNSGGAASAVAQGGAVEVISSIASNN